MSTSNINVDQLIGDDSFRAWTEGRAGSDEKKQWDRWVQQSTKNRRLARRAQAEITGFSFTSSETPHTSQAWNRLQGKIAEHDRSVRPLSYPSQRSRRTWKYYGVVASVLLILAAGSARFLAYQPPEEARSNLAQKTITTDYGERKTITFSKGKSIVLGAHSTLSYVVGQQPGRPERITLRGEAYFRAVHGSRPADTAFTVRTPDGQIADLGTQFVVSTREKETRVILKSGTVTVGQLGGTGKQLLLDPGQMARFNKRSSHIRVEEVNPRVYTSWVSNRLVFDRTPLQFIKKRVEQTFGTDVKICGDQLARRRLSGSIKNTSLHVIISSLANALNTNYTITDDKVYIGRNCH